MEYSPHLSLARFYWKQLIQPGDAIIDATCGNGKDSLTLGQLALTASSGKLYCLDIQENAILTTRSYLQKNLPQSLFDRVIFSQNSHETLSSFSSPIKGVVYNLGYLPGGDHLVTTKSQSTLNSVQAALNLIEPMGFVSLTCYPGHIEGLTETKIISKYINTLSSRNYRIILLSQPNKELSPKLFIIIKIN